MSFSQRSILALVLSVPRICSIARASPVAGNGVFVRAQQVARDVVDAAVTCTESATVVAGPVVETVNAAAHPMVLYSMPLGMSSQSPLTYGPTHAVSYVPGPPGCYGLSDDTTCTLLQRRSVQTPQPVVVKNREATAVLPNLAAETTTCTHIANASPTTTVPSFCHPTNYINAPVFKNSRSLPIATATIDIMPNKLSCCAQCAGVFNCLAWAFVPSYTQAPDPRLPGGFDPWGRGSCEVVYHVGNPGRTETGLADTSRDKAPAVCPNGKVGEVLGGSANPNGGAGRWSNLFYNGWNEGACGNARGLGTAGSDRGFGDDDTLCGA